MAGLPQEKEKQIQRHQPKDLGIFVDWTQMRPVDVRVVFTQWTFSEDLQGHQDQSSESALASRYCDSGGG